MRLAQRPTLSIALAVFAGSASADLVTGTITADNHYALYSSLGAAFSYHGGNELGAGGSPGQYNWSEAETYAFNGGDFIYIAAWSDDAVAQGVLGQFQSSGLGTILSGDSRWQVYATNINLGDGDPHPTASAIAGHVGFADTNALWESTYAGGANGVAPWSTIAGISPNARWMWKNVPGDPDPLEGGSGAAEMLIFRTVVPSPGTLALAALGGAALLRRRR
jgi:uncharacterized protein (TIGR03382 family)